MKKQMLMIMLAVGMLLVGGCFEAYQHPPRIAFNVDEYEALPPINSGSATIEGQAFLKTMVGEVKYAAGNSVFVTPKTSYSDQVYYDYFLPLYNLHNPYAWQQNQPPKADIRYKAYFIDVIADGEGRFEFKNVPAGYYYITTSVFWWVPTGRYTSSLQGSILMKEINVEVGQKLKVILTSR